MVGQSRTAEPKLYKAKPQSKYDLKVISLWKQWASFHILRTIHSVQRARFNWETVSLALFLNLLYFSHTLKISVLWKMWHHYILLPLHLPWLIMISFIPFFFAWHWAISKRHLFPYVLPLEAHTLFRFLGQDFWHAEYKKLRMKKNKNCKKSFCY